MSDLAFPKRPRVPDRGSVEAYRLTHPTCEIAGCRHTDLTVHHIKRRAQGGSDDEKNLARLCLEHHLGGSGWHTLAPQRWFDRFHDALSRELHDKILLAVPKLTDRRCVC